MNLYERATKAAQDILDQGLFSTCALMQTNQHRGGSLNLMHPALRSALDNVQNHTVNSIGPSLLTKTIELVEQLRFAVNFGLFKDLRNPPYRLDETPGWRTKVQDIEAQVNAVLALADGMACLDPRSALEKIRDHLKDAERLWSELPRQAQDELNELQSVNEDTSLRHCLRWGAQHAEELVDLTDQTQGAKPA